MPIVTDVYVACSVCSRRSENPGVDSDDAVSNAQAEGWQVGERDSFGEGDVPDLCPFCLDAARGALADAQAERET